MWQEGQVGPTSLSQPESSLRDNSSKLYHISLHFFYKEDLIFRVARDLLLEPQSPTELHGPVQFVHQWLDMSQVAKLLKYWQNHSKKQKQQAYF